MSSSRSFEIVAETGERIAATARALRLPGGRSVEMCVESGQADGISTYIASGQFAIPAHYRLLEALVPAPGRVIDLGAHIGTFSVYAASLGHEVIAVEASRRNIALLRENVQRNALASVRIVHAAVAEVPGHTEFIELGAFGLLASPLLQWPTVRVPTVTVDGMLDEAGWGRVDFVKMDIEGSEPRALGGMTNTLGGASAPALVFESNGHTLNVFGETPNTLLDALARFGYTCWRIEASDLRPVAPEELQFDCVVDYLALNHAPGRLAGWTFRDRLSQLEHVDIAVSCAHHESPYVRAHTGRTARFADPRLLSDARMKNALDALARDDDPGVRDAVRWHVAKAPGDGGASDPAVAPR